MIDKYALLILTAIALAACGDSSTKSASTSPPVRTACTTPEQAGAKANDITRKLVEKKKQGAISADEYAAFNATLSAGFRAWAERQDLKAYCAALDKVVKDAGLN